MAEAAYKMQAFVVLREGMRLFYDCPAMSGESFAADSFFKKYHGKTATIAGFPTTPVGPFDRRGRLPGVYLSPGSINVQFEGEEEIHEGMNLVHFILLDPTTTVPYDEYDRAQRVGDLHLLFYPGDTVHKGDDLLQGPRVVQEVKFAQNGEPLYVLAETTEATERRMAAKAAEREVERAKRASDPSRMPMMPFSGHDYPLTETCDGVSLVLVERGPAYFLYSDPSKLAFASPEEELSFWTEDGLSKTFYGSRQHVPHWEWSLEKAREIVEQGKGDLILASRRSSSLRGGGAPKYTVRTLHSCFDQHRSRVRELTLATAAPPPEREKSITELAGGLLGD